jgi:type III restriction enzyme
MVEEYGTEGAASQPTNARKKRTVLRTKQYELSSDFKELWEKIKHKTRYAVKIETGTLITKVLGELEKAILHPPRVTVTKASMRIGEGEQFEAVQMSAHKTLMQINREASLPNLIDNMVHLLEYTTPPVLISRKTLVDIFRRTSRKQEAMSNPQEFATVAVRIIKDQLTDLLVAGIQYEQIDEWYEMALFQEEFESWEQYLIPAEKSVYEQVPCDSNIERSFVEGLEGREDVRLFVKLPGWFTVTTPVGDYNPDWAIVMDETDAHGEVIQKLYLVRETKSTHERDALRPDERRKIDCGEKHFKAIGVDYRVVTDASELP